MKNLISIIFTTAFTIASIYSIGQSEITGKDLDKWFYKKEWIGGVPLQPSKTVNKAEVAKQYQLNKTYWDKAFAFIRDNDLANMAPGKYAIDGENVYATITENKTKDFDSTKWESHRNYIDLQTVITGEEKIGLASIGSLTVAVPYDATKDLANYTGDGKLYEALPGTFFLFFPGDAHRPNITTGGNKPDKKLVIKIRYTN